MKLFAASAGRTIPRVPVLCQKLNLQLERSVDVQVTRLRRKIEDDPKIPLYIQTVRGTGYVLIPDRAPPKRRARIAARFGARMAATLLACASRSTRRQTGDAAPAVRALADHHCHSDHHPAAGRRHRGDFSSRHGIGSLTATMTRGVANDVGYMVMLEERLPLGPEARP